jgi:hypothetical protein
MLQGNLRIRAIPASGPTPSEWVNLGLSWGSIVVCPLRQGTIVASKQGRETGPKRCFQRLLYNDNNGTVSHVYAKP